MDVSLLDFLASTIGIIGSLFFLFNTKLTMPVRVGMGLLSASFLLSTISYIITVGFGTDEIITVIIYAILGGFIGWFINNNIKKKKQTVKK